jgi:hypothetical protein
MKSRDWSSLPSIPWIKLGNEEWKWVEPRSFFDVLPEVLDACPPLPGEEGLYALVRWCSPPAPRTRRYTRCWQKRLPRPMPHS